MIHVCSLARLHDTVSDTGARHIVTLIKDVSLVRRPECIPEPNHPLVVHCYAGISRSTAGAFIAACALNPQRDERAIARLIREASPTAMPNLRLVALADALLGRKGRMIKAVDSLGPGLSAYEGVPFRLDLE